MTSDEFTSAAVAAGLDTPDKVIAAFSNFSNQISLRKIEAQIEALNQKRADALVPFDQERVELNGQRATLIAAIK